MPSKKTYEERRKKGLCGNCGRKPIEVKGKAMCQQCLDHRKQRYRKAIQDGRCEKCGKPSGNGKTKCKTCVLKNAAYTHLGSRKRWKELEALYESQNGACAITGVCIEIGVNAHVDHIIPKSKGGAINDISNLQYLHQIANMTKGNSSDEEFREPFETFIDAAHAMKEIDKLPPIIPTPFGATVQRGIRIEA
jgi:5-methylcytosine-specific restriction endonuclease McrA